MVFCCGGETPSGVILCMVAIAKVGGTQPA